VGGGGVVWGGVGLGGGWFVVWGGVFCLGVVGGLVLWGLCLVWVWGCVGGWVGCGLVLVWGGGVVGWVWFLFLEILASAAEAVGTDDMCNSYFQDRNGKPGSSTVPTYNCVASASKISAECMA